MKKACPSLLMMVLLVIGAGPAAAQDEGGMGGFIDWLHKLSGPGFAGPGITWYQGLSESNPLRFRASAGITWMSSTNDKVVPDDASITRFFISPSLEYPLGEINLEVSAGVAVNIFGGDADSFTRLSFPLMVQWRPPVGNELFFRLGVGVNVFTAFGEDDFQPLAVVVNRDGADFGPFVMIGLEWERGSWFN